MEKIFHVRVGLSKGEEHYIFTFYNVRAHDKEDAGKIARSHAAGQFGGYAKDWKAEYVWDAGIIKPPFGDKNMNMEKRQRDLIEMLIKQAGYKESGQMYVNNDVRSAFGIKELFPDEPSDKPSYESICSQLLRSNQRIKELEAEHEPKVKRLTDALSELVRCNQIFKDNLLSADVTLAEFTNAVDNAKHILELFSKQSIQ